MAYRRVTVTERRLVRMWRQAGYGQREIARRLGRSASTICREIARNTGGIGYLPQQAHRMAQERAKRPGPRRFPLPCNTRHAILALNQQHEDRPTTDRLLLLR